MYLDQIRIQAIHNPPIISIDPNRLKIRGPLKTSKICYEFCKSTVVLPRQHNDILGTFGEYPDQNNP